MHYAIAKLITESIEIRNKNKFILGNLVPDLSSQEDGSYMYNYNTLFIHKYQLKNEIHEIDRLEVVEANIKYKESLIKGLISDFS